ncbi:MAG: ABC transporter ATP-binding protein [Desulfarculaceae bacterium]|nr:ABC transporter ATP-binding protein [Desulfarculaceae bacterium]MCF8074063.1 ABC transporter ATP-binding protein [Desulfarculaceae bacterium]MCF8102099.1 ABC transporter ATP-binding protein [Desulfarculaceae bacterium]MCF8117637.1 ABC transporter ATP-binding protein [Desulfarculaceae bacterium]
MILSLVDVNTFYGTSHILQDISLGVGQGEVVALLGRNGVGKTTTLRTIMGLTPPASGGILFQGQEVQGDPPWNKAKLGLAYMPDDLRIFPDLTCEENLDIAAKLVKREGFWDKKKVMSLFPVLAERRDQKGLNMSGGEKKMLSLGRALMSNPAVVLLDEPSEGLAPLIVRTLAEAIETIRSHGMTILLADQNLKFCRRVSDRGYIIEKGQIVHEGDMEDIWDNQDVVNKYLAL